MQYVLLLGALQAATDHSTPDCETWELPPSHPADFFLQQLQHLENKILQEESERTKFQEDRQHQRELQNQNQEISKLREDKEKSKKKVEDSSRENQTLEECNQRLISELSSQKAFNNFINTNKDLKVISDQCEKLLECDEEIRELTEKVDVLQKECASQDCVKERNSELRAKLDETKEQRRVFKEELSDAEKKKSEIQQNRELLQNKNVNQIYQDLKNKILYLEQEIESMNRKNHELAHELFAFQTGSTEVEKTPEDVTEEPVADKSALIEKGLFYAAAITDWTDNWVLQNARTTFDANVADMEADVMQWHIADNFDTE